jgi:hypothetical protein
MSVSSPVFILMKAASELRRLVFTHPDQPREGNAPSLELTFFDQEPTLNCTVITSAGSTRLRKSLNEMLRLTTVSDLQLVQATDNVLTAKSANVP